MYKGGCKLFVEQIIEDASKTEDARQEDACLHPPVSLSACIKGFTKEIRKKVHRLLYHSLCTNVVAGEGLVRAAAWSALGSEAPQGLHSLPRASSPS